MHLIYKMQKTMSFSVNELCYIIQICCRLLEVMAYGCIPVLMGDNYEVPFSEVLNWKGMSLYIDEDRLTEVRKSP